MKEIILIIMAGALALPGCITQRRIADQVEHTTQRIDSLLSEAKTVLPAITEDTYVLPAITDEITDTATNKTVTVSVPVQTDTSRILLPLDSLTTRAQTFDTGTHTVTVTPVTDNQTGAVTLDVQTVSKSREIPVQIVYQKPILPPKHPPGGSLFFS